MQRSDDNVKSTEANILTHLFLADCDGSEETWLPGIVDLFLVIWSGVRGDRVPPAPPTLGHRRSGHWIVWNCIGPTRPTTSTRIPVCTTIEAAAVTSLEDAARACVSRRNGDAGQAPAPWLGALTTRWEGQAGVAAVGGGD